MWEYIDGLHFDTFKLLKEHKENPSLPNNGAPLPINKKTISDIRRREFRNIIALLCYKLINRV
nr:unnamed protein product [Callosobruchus analis]